MVNESQFADVGLGDLTDYDCVCFCDVARLSPTEVRRLETHLRRGGGAIFTLGDQVDLGAYNESLYRSGQGLLPARLEKKQAARDRTWFQFKDADYTRTAARRLRQRGRPGQPGVGPLPPVRHVRCWPTAAGRARC